MDIQRIPTERYRTYPDLVADMLANKLPEFSGPLFSYEQLAKYAGQRPFNKEKREILVNTIRDQYTSSDLEITGSRVGENIESLSRENTYTITTGHQLCLLSGPLYFLIKILHVCKTAQEFNKRNSEYNLIPVFWMASEDHDFEEINKINMFGQSFVWNEDVKGAVGHQSVSSFEPVLQEILDKLGDSDRAADIAKVLTHSYQKKFDLSQATRNLVHALFKDYGVVIIDADHFNFKSQFKEEFKKDILQSVSFNEVTKSINNLEKSHYKIQVNPREINLFYLAENNRQGIVQSDTGYELRDQSKKWTESELLEELDSHPESFSPNVVMRPIYQEAILPNLCYVGGPSEIAYWLELKSSFEALGIPFPLLNLRNSILWLDKQKVKKIHKLGMELNDLFEKPDEVAKKMAMDEDDDQEIESFKTDIANRFNSFSELISSVDPTLKPYLLAEGKKIDNQLNQIKGKLIRARKQKNEEQLNSFWNLYEKVFPGGGLLERYDNFVPYYLKYGEVFFEEIYKAIDPEDVSLKVIVDSQ